MLKVSKLQTITTEYKEMLNKVTNNNYRIRRNAQQSKLQTITTEYEEMLNKVTNNNYRIRRNAQSK